MPQLRGKLRADAPLAPTNWFRVGGAAELLFRPADVEDLAYFMKHKPDDVPVMALGVGSNVIVRDGGIDGVVIKLGRGFTDMRVDGEALFSGAANLDVNVANYAADHGLAGVEFLSGIPGTIGGALRMNAGAYGAEVKDCLIAAEVVTGQGEIKQISVEELGYTYRHCTAPSDWIFTGGYFATQAGEPSEIHKRIAEIKAAREESQPVRERTGGSTFKNPEGHKAWKLVDEAGLRGYRVGGAMMSEKHCNFMINASDASAADLERLGDEVREKVKAQSGVELQWEVQRIGKK